MAQIKSITSEALEATIRNLLPSQQGFGEDLQAQNVIVPVLDITPTAEGSQLRSDLASAINFTDATVFNTTNTVDTIVSTPGFYRILGAALTDPNSATAALANIQLDNGLSTKVIWGAQTLQGIDTHVGLNFDFVVFLDTGISLQTQANTLARVKGSVRQIADRYGNIQNPSGFTFE